MIPYGGRCNLIYLIATLQPPKQKQKNIVTLYFIGIWVAVLVYHATYALKLIEITHFSNMHLRQK